MIQSQNTEVTYTCKANYFHGTSSYGEIIIGDKAFEFYNEKIRKDYVQIPWGEIDEVVASVIFNKWISRFAIFTKSSGHFSFSARNNKLLLKEIQKYFDKDKMYKSQSIISFIKNKITSLFNRK